MASSGGTGASGTGASGSASGSGPSGSKKIQRKNAPGNRSDIGWQHGYEVENDSRKIKCKYCEKIITGSIYRLKHHLACTKKDIGPCPSVPDEVKKLMLQILIEMEEKSNSRKKYGLDEGENSLQGEVGEKRKEREVGLASIFKKRNTSQSSQTTINQIYKKELREEACQQVARFFYTSAIPFNCVKNPEFEKMCHLIGKYGMGFKPPSYHEIREKYLKQEMTRMDEMLEEHKAEWKKTGCTIMTDGWTDKKRRSIINFLVNSPKGTVFLKSIDASDICKTAEKIFKMIDEVVEEVGEENVVQVVTDNAANYKAAGQMLMEKRKKLYWTPCAAHCIDLMLEDFEKKIKVHGATIKKGRKITTFIYSRSMLISMLKNFTKGKDLIRPAVTRFATAYLTLGCLMDNKGGLMTMFGSNQWKSSRFAKIKDGKMVENYVLDGRFWKNIVTCLKGAYPLIKVLRMVDSDEKPAMGFIYEEMDRAKETIQTNFKNVKKR